MATAAYMQGRQRYARPQGMLWSNNPGTLQDGVYLPVGYEIGSVYPQGTSPSLIDEFIILSDDNRASIDFAPVRIEKRERMINGRMRSYHIADKLTISTSWSMLPSRSYLTNPEFDPTNGNSQYKNLINQEYTSDGGAGGVEILDWYENHKGPFWVFLSYDKYTNFGREAEDFAKLGRYSQLLEMYISDFSYSVQRRGGTNYDFWNISVTLEEV